MEGMDSEHLQGQAQQIWSMLDDMAANDPAAYRKFIDRQIKEGKESMAPPQPHMCVRTATWNPKSTLYINVCSWPRMPEPKSDVDAIPVIGSQLQTVSPDTDESYKLVSVAFNPKVLDDYGRNAERKDERDALINLAIDYLVDQHSIQISRHFQILPEDKPLMGSVDSMVQSFSSKTAKEDEKFEKELDELEKTFGPMASGAKNTILHQLNNITAGNEESVLGGKTGLSLSQRNILLHPQNLDKPIKNNLIEELGDSDRRLSCPSHSVETKHGCVVVCIQLPGVQSVAACELDISEDDLSLIVPDKYKLFLRLPERVQDEQAKAKFNKKTEELTVTVPLR